MIFLSRSLYLPKNMVGTVYGMFRKYIIFIILAAILATFGICGMYYPMRLRKNSMD